MAAPKDLPPLWITISKPRPNHQSSPGSIGNTPGLITPKPSPNGTIEAGQPTANTDPPAVPETPQEVSFWGKISGGVHTGLDILGFVPGLGAIPDLANAAIYAMEGDMVNAGISAVAAVPGIGDAAKAGTMVAKGAKAVVKGVGKEGAEKAAKEAAEKTAKEAEERAAKEAKKKAGDGDGGYSQAPPMKRHEVPCFKKGKGNKATDAEYDRQLADQQKALNQMSAEDYQRARDAYQTKGRDPGAAAETARFRSEFEAAQKAKLLDQKRASGMSLAQAITEAKKEAADIVKGLDALHAPDLIAGGNSTPAGMGHPSANRSIGRQWPQNGRIAGLDSAVEDAAKTYGKNTKLNVKLKRCK